MPVFRDRGAFRLPFLRINWARKGLRPHYTSTTLKVGRWTWNSRTRQWRYDHWGPGWLESKRKKRRR